MGLRFKVCRHRKGARAASCQSQACTQILRTTPAELEGLSTPPCSLQTMSTQRRSTPTILDRGFLKTAFHSDDLAVFKGRWFLHLSFGGWSPDQRHLYQDVFQL